MRNKFIESLCHAASKDDRIVMIVGDLGYKVVEPFADAYPDRFVNAGIAEQNMTGLAAGMASEGYVVFVYSIGNFPTYRCAEQIRNDVDYHNLPVVTVTVGGGLAYGNLGYSHHAIQDLSLMRSMPNTRLYTPVDPVEVDVCVNHIISAPGPSYLRLGKAGEKTLHSGEITLNEGQPQLLVNRSNAKAIIAIGRTFDIVNGLTKHEKFSDFSVFSMPCWSMASKKTFVESLDGFEEIVTLEDHLIDGGFGSWVLEAFMEHRIKTNVRAYGLKSDVAGEVASEMALLNRGNLSVEYIVSDYS